MWRLRGWRSTLGAGALAVAAFGPSCGDGGAPSVPQAPPASAPVPPSVAAVSFLSVPHNAAGWTVGETIVVQILFSETVSVSGSPRLALGIGSETRFAAFREESSGGAFVVFQYHVAREDRDEDGLSVEAGAVDLNGATIRNAAGLDADLDLGMHTVENDSAHLVFGALPLQECTDERERAERFSDLVPEWDGTPFRVDLISNFPDFVTEANLVELLAAVGLLADKVERQLGYRIVEMGEVIPIPAGIRQGWDIEAVEGREGRSCLLPRETGQILGFYGNTTSPRGVNAPAEASTKGDCQYFFYLPPAVGMGDRWPFYQGCLDGITIHETFHMFGFVHSDSYDLLEKGEGVAMSTVLNSASGAGAHAATWPDIDLLRCIFPEGG